MFVAATNGVVLATEKKQKSILYDEQSIHKIEMITKNIGMVYSGMGPDYRYVFQCLNFDVHRCQGVPTTGQMVSNYDGFGRHLLVTICFTHLLGK